MTADPGENVAERLANPAVTISVVNPTLRYLGVIRGQFSLASGPRCSLTRSHAGPCLDSSADPNTHVSGREDER